MQGQGARAGAAEATAGEHGPCVPQLRALHHGHPPAPVRVPAAQQHQRCARSAAAVVLHLPHAAGQVPHQPEGGGAPVLRVHVGVKACPRLV